MKNNLIIVENLKKTKSFTKKNLIKNKKGGEINVENK